MIGNFTFPFVLVFTLLLILPSNGSGQTDGKKNFYLINDLDLEELDGTDRKVLDSSLKIYHLSKENIDKILALVIPGMRIRHPVAEKYQFIQLKLLKEAFEEQHSRKNKKELKRILAETLNSLGSRYTRKGNLKQGEEYLNESLKLRKAINQQRGVAETLNNLGYIYGLRGDVVKALDHYKSSMHIRKEIKDQYGYAESLNNIGLVYFRLGDITKALKCYKKSLSILYEIDHKKGIASSLLNIGGVYNMEDEPKIALRYFHKGLELCKNINFSDGISYSLSNIGNAFARKGDTTNALNYYKKSIEICKVNNNPLGVSKLLSNTGSLYSGMNKFHEAMKVYSKSLNISQQIGDKQGTFTSKVNLASIYVKIDSLDKAINCAENSLALAKKIGFPRYIQSASSVLSEAYEKKGKSDKALEMYRLFVCMKDSVNSKKNQEAIFRQKNNHLVDRKDDEIKLLVKQKELKILQLQLSFLIYGVILVLIILLSFLWYKRKRNRYEIELTTLRALLNEFSPKDSYEELTHIPVTLGKKMLLIEPDEISFFNAKNKYVLLNTCNGRSYVVDYTIAKLEDSLPGDFMRVHRSSIINRHKIKEIKKTYRGKVIFTLKDKNNSQISSSLAYSEQVKSLIKDYKLESV